MSRHNGLSRRHLFKGIAAAGGVAAANRIVSGADFIPSAHAQAAEIPALFVIFTMGGYNALFSNPQAFMPAGTFGVTANNVIVPSPAAPNYIVDSSFAKLTPFAKAHMASVGAAHGLADHNGARAANFTAGGAAPLKLAAGLGGNAAIKCAVLGNRAVPGSQTAVAGVSYQQITDMQATINALGGAVDATIPKREVAALGVGRSQEMSAAYIAANPKSLITVGDGFRAAVDTLKKPAATFDINGFKTDYGLTTLAVNSLMSQTAAAELMIRAGANVAIAIDNGPQGGQGWDSHGDRVGGTVRNQINAAGGVMAALAVFTKRILEEQGRNVVVMISGDFARSLPGSDHASIIAPVIIGKYVKPGNSFAVNANVGLAAGTPQMPGVWGYISALLKAPAAVTADFGGNPHTTVI